MTRKQLKELKDTATKNGNYYLRHGPGMGSKAAKEMVVLVQENRKAHPALHRHAYDK